MIKKQGFTLAEALIALVVMSLVVAATMPIIIKSQNAPSEAPFKYVTQGDLAQNAAVYSAIGGTATILSGDKRIPIDSHIGTNKDYVFSAMMNPKISIVARNHGYNPLISRHLIDFYEKETNGNHTNIGKMSFDKFLNLALGINSMASIYPTQSVSNLEYYTEPTWTELESYTENWQYKTSSDTINFSHYNGIDIGETIGAANTAIGQYSMGGDTKYIGATATDGSGDVPARNLMGSGNTAIGTFSMKGLTNGNLNTGVGLYALQYPSTNSKGTSYLAVNKGYGNSNTAIGAYALKYNANGSYNTALGTYSMTDNEGGHYNTAVGMYSLYANRTSISNTAVGYRALSCYNNEIEATTTGYNTAVGTEAGAILLNGIYNTILGYKALQNSHDGDYNIAIGKEALKSNSSYYNTGSYNIAIGNNALDNNTTGGANIVIGNDALCNNRTGSGNIIIGHGLATLSTDTAISNKLYIGGLVSYNNSTKATSVSRFTDSSVLIYGDMSSSSSTPSIQFNTLNTTIGSSVTISDTTYNPKTIIKGAGYINSVSNDNKIVTKKDVENLIDVATASEGNVNHGTYSGTIVSDSRLKNILGENTAGLKEIMQINVKNYTMKRDKKKEVLVGVIAQELQKVFPNSVMEGRDGYLRIKRDEIFYACVNAIKELHNMIKDVIAKITGLEEKIRILEDRNKLNEEKISALERQNKLFEERIKTLENLNTKKVIEKKSVTSKKTQEIKEEKENLQIEQEDE